MNPETDHPLFFCVREKQLLSNEYDLHRHGARNLTELFLDFADGSGLADGSLKATSPLHSNKYGAVLK